MEKALRAEVAALQQQLAQTREAQQAAEAEHAAAELRSTRAQLEAKHAAERLQEELTESRGECKRLAEQVSTLQTKMKSMQGAKREILACCAEMSDYLATRREQ